jgi:EAL domain-containing protein (putative c-di-GMP-specific phosphodiesterase class I)
VLSITAMALVAVALFALLTGRLVANQIEDQAIERARETADIIARSSFAPRLPPAGKRLAGQDLADLDRQLAAARGSQPKLQMRLWGADGSVVYASDRSLIGTKPPLPEAARSALAGQAATDVKRDGATDTSPGASLTSAAPVRRSAAAAPAGGSSRPPSAASNRAPVAAALEIGFPYAPIGADIRDRTRRLYLALLGAALVAYALALPALIRAGRAVRAQYDPRRVGLMREMQRAMKHGELVMHFHPIADARTGEVHTAEALIRWQHPERGLIAPDRFIPQIETTELMWPLTGHIFGLVARQARIWADRGLDVRTAVNVSSADVIDPRLPGVLSELLEHHQVAAGAMEIEVTEGAVMRDPEEATRVLERITGLGFGVVAIDDFGTGYSSLARLHELPLDELKIDQSFVMRMAREGDETVVRSIIELAHALGLKVIAEGVEDEETWARLLELGVDYIQGYVLTRPLPGDDFARWLMDSRTVRDASH